MRTTTFLSTKIDSFDDYVNVFIISIFALMSLKVGSNTSRSTRILSAAVPVVSVQSIDTALDQRLSGCTAPQMRYAGYSLQQLVDAGYDTTELRSAGYELRELKDVGCSTTQLKGAGYSAWDLKLADFSLLSIYHAGYTVRELLDAPFDPEDLRNVCGIASRSIREAVQGVTKVREILGDVDVPDNVRYNAKELKDMGKSAAEVREMGFSAGKLKNAGFSLVELRMAGFNVRQVRAAKFSIDEVRQAGYTIREMIDCGYFAKDLREAGFSEGEIKQVLGIGREGDVSVTGERRRRAKMLRSHGNKGHTSIVQFPYGPSFDSTTNAAV